MKKFLLMLFGKGINDTLDDSIDGVFKSECYYDWIEFRIIGKSDNVSPNNAEDLLVKSYNEEIKARQEMIKKGLHIQQGIIALPTNDEDTVGTFLNDVNKASVIYISFINVPFWSKNKRKELISSKNLDTESNVNELIKREILPLINKSSMGLFHTFDHNDFVLICNGEKTTLKNYLSILKSIRNIVLADKYFAVHDVTTIYGYKSSKIQNPNLTEKVDAVVSISGRNIDLKNKSFLFKADTIGRYDNVCGCKDITWAEFAKISKTLHNDNIITSRIHIGSEVSKVSSIKEDEYNINKFKVSNYYEEFKVIYKKELNSMNLDILTEIYGGDKTYVDSLILILEEIGFIIETVLKRGFAKYNIVCYIESYIYFLKYINTKVIDKFKDICINDFNQKYDNAKILAEDLVDISNSFYKSILMLDTSIMHNERRFIMSDPYHLTLFDIPPKLIAYYTSIVNQMAKFLNKDSNNRYVFLITPDIKKDIYVESITDNKDISNEINILIIHINEKNIYNITNTTRNLAHEIAHHIGQSSELRKKRAYCFVKCYIALLIRRGLDPDMFVGSDESSVFSIMDNLSDAIFNLVRQEGFFKDENNYYYMSNLEEKIYSFVKSKIINITDVHSILYKLFLKYFDENTIKSYIVESGFPFQNINFSEDKIISEYLYRNIIENIYSKLEEYFNKQELIKEDIKCIQFIFKEGHADTQMILLTEDPQENTEKIIQNYSKLLECVKDKIDEMMRKSSVVNTFLDECKRNYSNIGELDLIKKDNMLNKIYFMYICKQATSYFLEVKNKNNNKFNTSKVSLFESDEISNIVQQVDNTILDYIDEFYQSQFEK